MDHRRSLKLRSLRRTRSPGAIASAALLLLAGCVWLRSESGVANSPSAIRENTPQPISERTSPPAVIRPPPPLESEQGESQRVPSAEQNDVIAGPQNENLVPAAKPHPITPAHLYLYREVDLIESTWTALEQRDFESARALIEEHRAAYGGRNDDLDEGMALLADCMEHPDDEIRGRAQRFYDEKTYSSARRRIRRWCLES
jgi:hypothetical protein